MKNLVTIELMIKQYQKRLENLKQEKEKMLKEMEEIGNNKGYILEAHK